jgi:subtilisin-like proprotein convertase family protein
MKPTLHQYFKVIYLGLILLTTHSALGQFVTTTFTNATTFNVGPGVGNASLYPSTINVTGMPTSTVNVSVNIPNISHTFYDDIDILLVSPTGQRILLMSDCGGNNTDNGGTSNRNYTFTSFATTSLGNAAEPSATGTYLPTNFEAPLDGFELVGQPGAPTTTTLTAFNCLNPNGNWNLYVRDDAAGDGGSIVGGWSITISAVNTTITGTGTLCVGSNFDFEVSGELDNATLPTGGTISTAGPYRVHSFTTTGASTFTTPVTLPSSQVLVVAGGGGGGMRHAGGGGAGGLLFNGAFSIPSGGTAVSVGTGGAGINAGTGVPAINNGQNSQFGGTMVAIGGGFGSCNGQAAGTGGSGGGGSNNLAGQPGTAGQGNKGGNQGCSPSTTVNGCTSGCGGCYAFGCGGGGAGAAAANNPTAGSDGGAGLTFNFTGANGSYAGGGGGGRDGAATGYLGGLGGGGLGGGNVTMNGANGIANTGGGGGGGGANGGASGNGGNGGSGIVLVRYLMPGSWTSSNTAVATVNQYSGLVTAVAPGTTTITYTLPSGCTSTYALTVSAQPGTPTISPASLCAPGTITASNAVTLYPAGANLVAHYPFYNNLNDVSGSGLNLTQTIGAAPDYTQGGLDITGRRFESAVTGILNNDNHTISFYVKFITPPVGAWQQIFAYSPAGTDRSPGIWRTFGDSRLHWRYDGANSGYNEASVPAFALNTWYEVVGVKNGATFSYYINGVLAATAAVTNPKFAGNAALVFGQTGYPAADGTIIRDFKVFNTVLTPAQSAGLGQINWYTGSCGGTAIGWNPSISVSSGTTYYVNATNVCGTSACASITVNTASTAPSITAIPGTVCPNTDVTLTASGGTAGTGSNIYWYTGPNGTGSFLGTGGSIVVAPAATTTYYARREGTCNTTTDATVTVNVKTFVYAANGTSTNTYCTDNAGWHHFYSGNNIILSVQGDLSGAAPGFPVVTIFDNGTYYQETQGPGTAPGCASNINPGEERFEMARSWDVNLGGGSPVGTYNVRFYHTTAERTTIENAAIAWMATYPACGYIYKYATPLGFYWFKNTGSAYTAPDYDGTHFPGSTGTTVNGINYAQITGIPSFSGGSGALIVVPAVALPVELTSFTALCNETSDEIAVHWSTASESNSAAFEVEYSKDGMNWNTVATLAAAGNSTQLLNYNFNHQVARNQATHYYRLKQSDKDGAIQQYGPITASCLQAENGFELFPNPAGTDVTLVLHGQFNKENLKVIFTDMNGKEVKNINYNDQDGKIMSIDIEQLQPGMYIVKLIDGDTNSQFVRLIKQ